MWQINPLCGTIFPVIIVTKGIFMICFKKVTKQLDDYKSVKELYLTAFPPVERVPFWLLMKKSKNDGAGNLQGG